MSGASSSTHHLPNNPVLHYVDCRDRSVLDIGGYDGRAAATALDLGARSAIVVDNGEWTKYGWPPPGDATAGRATFLNGDFLTLPLPKSDIVICLLVIYHLQDPIAGIHRLRKLTRHFLILSTSTVLPEEAGPDGWLHYPDGSGHENGTVWARPSRQALLDALTRERFSIIHETEDGRGLTLVCQCLH